jgi:alpha-beta hydrolase superfamily lysophospholipase
VEDAVQRNCGKRAILMGHSMGTLVLLGLLHSPQYAKWRCVCVLAVCFAAALCQLAAS